MYKAVGVGFADFISIFLNIPFETKLLHFHRIFGPRREKTCLRCFANNKAADQPAHTRSLISAFVIR